MSEFARRTGLGPKRLSWWKKDLGEGAPSRSMASELRLVPVFASVATELVSAKPADGGDECAASAAADMAEVLAGRRQPVVPGAHHMASVS